MMHVVQGIMLLSLALVVWDWRRIRKTRAHADAPVT